MGATYDFHVIHFYSDSLLGLFVVVLVLLMISYAIHFESDSLLGRCVVFQLSLPTINVSVFLTQIRGWGFVSFIGCLW